mgnify:CR=1 FL=1
MAAMAWCETEKCSLKCDMVVPRVTVRVDNPARAYLDYWDQQQTLASFREVNVVSISAASVSLVTVKNHTTHLSCFDFLRFVT